MFDLDALVMKEQMLYLAVGTDGCDHRPVRLVEEGLVHLDVGVHVGELASLDGLAREADLVKKHDLAICRQGLGDLGTKPRVHRRKL